MMTAPEPDGIVWHTSSFSSNGGTCVEVGWRTSSFSGPSGDCVEVAPAPEGVLVRDSKDRTGPPHRPHPRLARFPHHPHPLISSARVPRDDSLRLGDWRLIGVFLRILLCEHARIGWASRAT